MKKSMLKKIVFTLLLLGVVSFSANAEAASQGPYIKDGSIVQVTKKNYGMWQNFSWKKKNNTTNVYNQTFQAKGRYKHKNGQTYYSLYDSKGKWYGYLNSQATKKTARQGGYIADGSYVKITKKNYDMWHNFNWKKKDNTNNFYGKTLKAKGRYQHFNGATYYSLFDNKDKWCGYLNAAATQKTKPEGSYIKDGRYITVTKKNYDIWQNFSWKKRNNSTNVYGRSFQAKGRFEHANGSVYYSLYDDQDNWIGYLNQTATGKYQPKELNLTKTINKDVNGKLLSYSDGYEKVSEKTEKEVILRAKNGDYTTLSTTTIIWKLKVPVTDNNKELKNAKNKAKEVIAKLDLTTSEKTTYNSAIDKATSVSAVNTQLTNAKVQAEKNTKTKEEQKKLAEAKQKAKNTISTLNLTNTERTNFNTQLTNAKTTNEVATIVESAKKQSDKNNQVAEANKKLAQAKKDALSSIEKMNLNDNEKTNFTQQVNNGRTIDEINKIVVEAQKASDKNSQSVKTTTVTFTVIDKYNNPIDTIIKEVKGDTYKFTIEELGLGKYKSLSNGVLSGKTHSQEGGNKKVRLVVELKGPSLKEDNVQNEIFKNKFDQNLNSERLKQGKNNIEQHEILNAAAVARSKDLAKEYRMIGDITHSIPSDSEWYTILGGTGIANSSENIAMGGYGSMSGTFAADQLFKEWLNSKKGHKEIMMSTDITIYGLGFYHDEVTGITFACFLGGVK